MTRYARVLLAALMVLYAVPVAAQQLPGSPQRITAQSTGACNAGACAVFNNLPASVAVTMQLSGTFSATVQFEASTDGQNFVAVSMTNLADGTLTTTATAAGLYSINDTGFVILRVRATTWASGTVIIYAARGNGFLAGHGGGGSGSGDVSSNTSSSVDSEIALFSGTGGKTIKRATGSGVAHVTSGVFSASSVVNADIANTTIAEAKFNFTDLTTANASASAHGLLPKLSGSSSDCFKGDGSFAACGASTGDFSTNTSTSAAGEMVTFADTTGKLGGRSLFILAGPASTPKTYTFPNASTTILTTNAAVTVAQGGTGITSGTSGGIPYFSGTTSIASSAELTINLPVFGGGAGATPFVGTRQGNTTKVLTYAGSAPATGDCLKVDASGNATTFGAACGGTGSPAGSSNDIAFNTTGSFAADTGVFTYNPTTKVFKTKAWTCNYVTKTANYTMDATPGDCVIEGLTNAFNVTLVAAATAGAGRLITVKNLQTANTVTIVRAGSDTIDGATSLGVVNGSVTLQSDGVSSYRVVTAAGLPIGALAIGDMIYASAANVPAVLSFVGTADRVLMNTGASNTIPAWGQVSSAAIASNAVTLAKMATQANLTILSNYSGGADVPVANTYVPLNTPLIYVSAVTQSGVCSIAFSTAASGGPVCSAVDGTNQHYGALDWTATGKPIYFAVPILETLTSTTVTVTGQFYCDGGCTGGNVGWTLSYRRVPDAGTMDQSFTGCSEITVATPTSGQKKTFSGTCSITSLAKNDLLQAKFDNTTSASTPGTVHLLNLTVMPVASKPIGGG